MRFLLSLVDTSNVRVSQRGYLRPGQSVTEWRITIRTLTVSDTTAAPPRSLVLPRQPLAGGEAHGVGQCTVKLVEPAIEPAMAVIVALPAVIPKASPEFDESLLMLATLLVEEVQVTEARIWV